MRGTIHLVLLPLRLGSKWPIQPFLPLVAIMLEEYWPGLRLLAGL